MTRQNKDVGSAYGKHELGTPRATVAQYC